MAEEPDETDATEIVLDGDGAFRLPVCTDLLAIAVGEALAFLQLETEDRQRVEIPVPIGLLVELESAVREALQLAVAGREGPGLQ